MTKCLGLKIVWKDGTTTLEPLAAHWEAKCPDCSSAVAKVPGKRYWCVACRWTSTRDQPDTVFSGLNVTAFAIARSEVRMFKIVNLEIRKANPLNKDDHYDDPLN